MVRVLVLALVVWWGSGDAKRKVVVVAVIPPAEGTWDDTRIRKWWLAS